jgi:palmitoyl-protein thioesterase
MSINFSSWAQFALLVLIATTLVASSFAMSMPLRDVAAKSGNTTAKYRPCVLMHGLFATSEAMGQVKTWLEQDFPGIYVKNVEIATGKNRFDSMLIPMDEQIQIFHQRMQSDPQLREGGFDLIGHSQGGLLTRSYIERYGHFYKTPIHNYISLAGVQNGQYGVPDINDWCPDKDPQCDTLLDLMNQIAYGKWAEPLFQKYISFAQYWKDPKNESAYLELSGFLADVNNERAVKNSTYRMNLISVNKVFLLHALMDHIVIPSVSEHFQFYGWGQDSTVQASITKSPTFQGDWIGLKTLDQMGKLHIVDVNCTHQGMPREVCKSQVYEAWIKPNVGELI